MSKTAKSGFSNPHQESTTPSGVTMTDEKEEIISQLNELTNQRQEISDEKEKLTNQIKKIGIEKKKIAYETAQAEYEKEELINQLRDFTKIASESTLVNLKPKKTGWSSEEFVEDIDLITTE